MWKHLNHCLFLQRSYCHGHGADLEVICIKLVASLTFSKNAITMTTTMTTSISASSSDLREQLRFVTTWHLPVTHSLTLCPERWPYCRDRWKLTDTGMPTHTHKCLQACLIHSRGILYRRISRNLARTHKSCTLTHLASEFKLSNCAKLNL